MPGLSENWHSGAASWSRTVLKSDESLKLKFSSVETFDESPVCEQRSAALARSEWREMVWKPAKMPPRYNGTPRINGRAAV